jgi:hypothetical protein
VTPMRQTLLFFEGALVSQLRHTLLFFGGAFVSQLWQRWTAVTARPLSCSLAAL